MKITSKEEIVKHFEKMLYLATQGVFSSVNEVTLTSNRDPQDDPGCEIVVYNQREGWAKRVGEHLMLSEDNTFDDVHRTGIPTMPPITWTATREEKGELKTDTIICSPAPGQSFRYKDGYAVMGEDGNPIPR